MTVAHETPKYTIKDYMALPEGERVELIHGELLMSTSPRYKHQKISGEIYLRLAQWVKEHHLGEVLEAPLDVVLSEHDVIQPDILYISNERKQIITEDNIQGAPDLIIEILSRGQEKRDTIQKKSLYEKHNVKEYWIVDPETKTISVFLLREKKYSLQQTCAESNLLKSPTLANFELSLTEIFS